MTEYSEHSEHTMHCTKTPPQHAAEERGFVLLALLATILPLIVFVGASASTMTGRNRDLQLEIYEERALLAAESGIDGTMHRIRAGIAPASVAWTRNLGNGMAFSVQPTHWKTDLVDNDGNGTTDDDEEDLYHLVVTGTYRNVSRKLGAVVYAPTPGPLLPGALYLGDRTPLQFDNPTKIIGWDKNLNGGPPASPQNVPGVGVTDAGDLGWYMSNTNSTTKSAMQGTGGTPSIAPAPPPAPDIAAMVAYAAANSTITFANGTAFTGSFGNASIGDYRLAYCNGSMDMKENSYGAGVLVVTGNLQVLKGARFDGILIVLGDLQIQEANIYGSLLVGPNSPSVQIQKSKVQYSNQAISGTASLLGPILLGPGDGIPAVRAWRILRR